MLQGFYWLARAQMRRRQIALAVVGLLTLGSMGGAVSARLRTAPTSAPVEPTTYIAHIEGDRLVISHAHEVVLRTAIDVRTLPEADRAALDAGISLADTDAIARLLEDYGS